MQKKPLKRHPVAESGEFLWLISLSDLMMLLFIFFVVMFSFSYKQMKSAEFSKLAAMIRHEPIPQTPIDTIQKEVNQWIKQKDLKDQITVQKVDDALRVEIKDKILFKSGEYKIHEAGIDLLKHLSGMLNRLPKPYRIGIEGHTDDVPIHTGIIEDNWDLSAKRAASVLRALELSEEILHRTVILAHGDTDPIAPNLDPSGTPIESNRNKNRRVTIKVF